MWSQPWLFKVLRVFCGAAQIQRACNGITTTTTCGDAAEALVFVFLFPLQQDMAVPPGSAATCSEELPAWTEQKLTRAFGAGSGYAGSRPSGIFAFQFQTGNNKRIQLTGSVVWEDTQRHTNREKQECWWKTFSPLKCMATTAPLSSELNHSSTPGEHLWTALTLGNGIWPFQVRQAGGAGRNVSISSFSFFREDPH